MDGCEFRVTRVKGFVINDNNEILIATTDDGCQFLGGHVENGEPMNDAVIKEVLEEIGITINKAIFQKTFMKLDTIKKIIKTSAESIDKLLYKGKRK